MTRSLLPYLPRLLVEWHRETPELDAQKVDGTLVFVDISGFTKMSERLARKGKVGSEEVTDVLTATFSRLLAAAYEDGGGLLKFGGDALLLFFAGAEHAVRGVHAAAAMRRKLRELGRIKTTAGFVHLRMSIGVHSDSFDMFVVGERHRELILAGPAVTTTVLMEHAANAGDILMSGATASVLDHAYVGAAREGGFLLRKPPPPPRFVPTDTSASELADLDLSTYVPEAVRKRLVDESVESEHRQVTVAFVHFDGTDELLGHEESAVVADRLDRLVRVVQEAAALYEISFVSSDVDADGGKLILMAGAPVATDNDEERMLRAVRAIADATTGLPVRVGVNRGPVFVGDVGPPFRRAYTIIGDAVNLAARVMAKAGPGEVLVTAPVLDGSGVRVEAEALEPFMVKGKSRPVTAFRIGTIGGALDTRATTRLPLVGRDSERDRLLDALSSADAGQGRVALITGDAGSGKTRLVQELRARAQPRVVVASVCEQYGAATAYLPFRRLLRSIAGIDDGADAAAAGLELSSFVARVAPHVTPWVPLLAVPFGADVAATAASDEIAPKFRSARMRDAVVDLLSAALPEPALIVLEDIHWIDDASRDLLDRLVSEVGERPWLLCLNARADGLADLATDDGPVVRVVLDRLTPQASEALAAAAAESVLLPQTQVELAARRSDGHPLFLLELVTAMASGEDADELPDTVEALITARIDRLPARERALLSQASVLGSPFELAALADLVEVDEPDVVSVLDRLGDVVELEAPGRYRFRKSLFAEVCYAHLPYRRRRLLHQRAGEEIERRHGEALDDHAAVLSLHFSRAHDSMRAWRYARIAGARAQASYANVEAATLFRRAVEAGRLVDGIDAAELAATWEALGDVQQLAGLYELAALAYASARRLGAGDEAALMRKQGTLDERRGRYSQALRWYGRANAHAGEHEQVRLKVASAVARQRQGRYRDAIMLCHEAVSAAEALGDRESLAYAHFLLHAAHTDLGDGDATDDGPKALALYEELGDLIGQANVLESMGIAAYWEGRWDESLSLYERSGDLRDRAGHVVYARFATNNMAEILSDRGDWPDADILFAEARRVWRAAKYPFGVAMATGNLGRSAVRAGRFDEGRTLLLDALEQWTTVGGVAMRLETEARLAELDVFEGRYDDAVRIVEATLAESPTAILQSLLYRSLGIAQRARSALDTSLDLAREAAAPYEEALTLAAIGRDADANVIFRRLGVRQVRSERGILRIELE